MAIAETFPPEDDLPDGEAMPDLSGADQLAAWADMDNVAGELEEAVARNIATRVIEEYQIDKSSRSEWEEEARAAMDAVLQKTEPKSHPWPGASNVKFPLITTATLQFGARSYPAIVQGDRVVRVKTVGRDPDGSKTARAERVSQHMSYQLLEETDGWEGETDIMLHQLPVLGHAFRKVYRDHGAGRNCAEMVSAMNFVVNQATKSIRDVPRATHEIELYPHQIVERIRDGRFVDFEYAAAGPDETRNDGESAQTDDDAPHLFLEQYRLWDLDGDGFPEPWICTVHKSSSTLVRLQANYDLDEAMWNERGEVARLPRYQCWASYPFIPDPNGGFYGIGFGRLLKSIGETVNTAINQLLDAGTLQNKGGGFIGSGLNTKNSKIPVSMNEWTVVNVPGQKIREAIVPHQFGGPSPVLFQLLGLMIDAGKQIASVQEVLSGEASAKTMQPTTLLALIEQGLKVFTAIIKRVFRGMSQEFGLLYELNRRYPDEQAYADVIDWQPPEELLQQLQQLEQQGQPIPPEALAQLQPPTMAADYEKWDRNLVPVADPNAVTDMQALGKAQVIWSANGHPNLNGEEALRRYFAAAKVEDIDKLITQQPQGPDPMQMMAVQTELRGKQATAADKMASANLKKVQAQALEAGIGETQARTAKTAVEAEEKRQAVAVQHAEIVSGAVDADREMDRALKEAQVNKTHAEARVSAKMKDGKSSNG